MQVCDVQGEHLLQLPPLLRGESGQQCFHPLASRKGNWAPLLGEIREQTRVAIADMGSPGTHFQLHICISYPSVGDPEVTTGVL